MKTIKNLLLVNLIICSTVYAAPDTFEIFDSKSKGIITCKKIDGIWYPGSVAKKTKEFTSFKDQIAQIKTRLASMIKKRPNLEQRLEDLKNNIQSQRRLCKNASKVAPDPQVTPRDGQTTPKPTATNSGGGTSTPKPTATAGHTATPKPSATSGSSACAQWSAGQSRYNSGCLKSGCHATKLTNRTTTMINNAFNLVPSMTAVKSTFSSTDISNIAAYLNSTTTSQCQ